MWGHACENDICPQRHRPQGHPLLHLVQWSIFPVHLHLCLWSFLFLSRHPGKYLWVCLRHPGCLDSLTDSTVGIHNLGSIHSFPLQLHKSFFVLLHPWGFAWEVALGPLYPEGTDVYILITYPWLLLSRLSSTPGKLFILRGDGPRLLKLPQTFG